MLNFKARGTAKPRECPHCLNGYLAWDNTDREPFCFNCGWRPCVHITPDEARLRRNWTDWMGLVRARFESENENMAKIDNL
jgi:hypothetical protein